MRKDPQRATMPGNQSAHDLHIPSRMGAALWTYLGGSGSAVLVAIQSLVLVPLYLTYLGARLYGAWLGSGEILVWLLAFDLGLPNLITQRIAAAHSDQDQGRVAAWLFSGALMLGVAAVVLTAGGFALSGVLPTLMGVEGREALELAAAFRLGCVATAVALFSNLFVAYSRGVQRTMFLNVVIVLSVAAGFATSLALILGGAGLMAIPSGMLTRSAITLLGGSVFMLTVDPRPRLRSTPMLRSTLAEAARLAPVTTLGGISFAITTRCELFVIASLGAPEMASLFMVVRKGAELGRTFMSILSFACYAPFSHLLASRDWSRVYETYASLRSLQSSLAVTLLGGYVVLNTSFVHVWVGTQYDTDLLLTALIAMQTFIYAEALLTNYLYRATGAVAEGSKAIAIEAIFRVLLLLAAFGATQSLVAVPLVGILTSAGLAWMGTQRLAEFMTAHAGESLPRPSLTLKLTRMTLILVTIVLGGALDYPSWLFLLVAGAAWVGTSGLIQYVVDEHARVGVRAPIRLLLQRRRT